MNEMIARATVKNDYTEDRNDATGLDSNSCAQLSVAIVKA